MLVNGEEINQMRAAKLAEFRRTHLGFIFQDFNLLDTLSIKKNYFTTCNGEEICK